MKISFSGEETDIINACQVRHDNGLSCRRCKYKEKCAQFFGKANQNYYKLKEIITNMEKSTIYGTITSAFFGSTKFSKDDMYRVSIKINKGNRDKLAEACAEMYKDSPDSFIPKWYKDENAEYINFKSKFDIKCIYDGDKETTTLDGYIKKYGNINGSNVGIAVKLDKGSIYPMAIKIYELKTTDFSDLFDETELPF